jgi:hypothetical protein
MADVYEHNDSERHTPSSGPLSVHQWHADRYILSECRSGQIYICQLVSSMYSIFCRQKPLFMAGIRAIITELLHYGSPDTVRCTHQHLVS